MGGEASHITRRVIGYRPLDAAIEAMRQTGLDMHERSRETSLGGLAVNVVAC